MVRPRDQLVQIDHHTDSLEAKTRTQTVNSSSSCSSYCSSSTCPYSSSSCPYNSSNSIASPAYGSSSSVASTGHSTDEGDCSSLKKMKKKVVKKNSGHKHRDVLLTTSLLSYLSVGR
ncbi:uncharacterized protein [Procambarus clarkii]|uniref:uncharacterized protein n=1 Tax=Procambarus clarkii TaxID=6728 RepID=UPI0037430855